MSERITTTFDQADAVSVERFSSFLREHPEALADKKRLNGFLLDVFHDQKQKVFLLTSAFAIGIVEHIQQEEMDRFFVHRHVKRLVDELGVTEANSEWAVQMWCEGYGHKLLGKSWDTLRETVEKETKSPERSNEAFTLDGLCGQEKNKKVLRAMLQAANMRGEQPGHILIAGTIGSGRYTLAKAIVGEAFKECSIVPSTQLSEESAVGTLLTNLNNGAVVIIRDIEKLVGRPSLELLEMALSEFCLDVKIGKGPSARSIRLDLPRFTVIATTENTDSLPRALVNCFDTVCRMEQYSNDDLSRFLQQLCGKMALTITPESADCIAAKCKGKVGNAKKILNRLRDFAQVEGVSVIDQTFASEKMEYIMT